MPDATEAETEEEAAQRIAEHEQRMAEYQAEQQLKEDERKVEFERQQKAYEAEQAKREKVRKARVATFERILSEAPASFNPEQLRVFLRLLININAYDFLEEAAKYYASDDDENTQQSDDGILLAALSTTADELLVGFALRIVLSDYVSIPSQNAHDWLAEAEQSFTSKTPKGAKPRGTPTKKARSSAVTTATKKVGAAEKAA